MQAGRAAEPTTTGLSTGGSVSIRSGSSDLKAPNRGGGGSVSISAGGAAALAGSVRTVAVTSGTVAVTSGFAAAGDSGAVAVSTIGGGRPHGPVR